MSYVLRVIEKDTKIVVYEGQQGEKGDTGEKGEPGQAGERGATFVPSMSPEGVLSWSNSAGLPNPPPADVAGIIVTVTSQNAARAERASNLAEGFASDAETAKNRAVLAQTEANASQLASEESRLASEAARDNTVAVVTEFLDVAVPTSLQALANKQADAEQAIEAKRTEQVAQANTEITVIKNTATAEMRSQESLSVKAVQDAEDAGLASLTEKESLAIDAIAGKEATALVDITEARRNALSAIADRETAGISALATKETSALGTIETKRVASVDDVEQASDSAQSAIAEQKASSVAALVTQQNASLDTIRTEGSAQVEAARVKADAAAGSASAASASAASAAISASEALASQQSASTSETAAAQSETAAGASAEYARKAAEGTDAEAQSIGLTKSSKGWAEQSAQAQVQSDWSVDDTTSKAHILNRSIVMDAISALQEKVADIELFKFPNATIIGSPTIQSGQVSGFTTSDYLVFPFIVDFRNYAFKIEFAFTTGSNVDTQQNILDSEFGLAVAIINGRMDMALSSNGSSWDIGNAVGGQVIEPQTTYYCRIVWDKTSYTLSLSRDGTTFITDIAIVSNKQPFARTMFIGGANTLFGQPAHPFAGSLNLNFAHLYIGNMATPVWSGMDSAGIASRADVSLGNIDEAGEAKIVSVIDMHPATNEQIDAMVI